MEDYAKAIDELRVKFDRNEKLSLREACWVLWAEKFVCSTQYLAFSVWIKQHELNAPQSWDIWEALYNGFLGSKENKDLNEPYMRKLIDKELKNIIKENKEKCGQ